MNEQFVGWAIILILILGFGTKGGRLMIGAIFGLLAAIIVVIGIAAMVNA